MSFRLAAYAVCIEDGRVLKSEGLALGFDVQCGRRSVDADGPLGPPMAHRLPGDHCLHAAVKGTTVTNSDTQRRITPPARPSPAADDPLSTPTPAARTE